MNMASLIYLLDTNLERAKAIAEKAAEQRLHLEVISKPPDLDRTIEKKSPEAIFVAFDCLENSTDLNFPGGIFTIVYGDHIDTDCLVSLYQKGVSRVIPWNSRTPGLLFQFYRTHLYRKTELRPAIRKSVSCGTTDPVLSRRILLNAITEQKSCIFKFFHGDWSAKLKICRGEVVEAICPGFKNEDALLFILQQESGDFRMKTYHASQETAALSASAFGVVVEANFQTNISENFLKKFGIHNPIFQKSPQFDTGHLTGEQKEMLNIIDMQNEYRNILHSSPFGKLKTIRFLENLYQLGAVSIDVEKADLLMFNPEDIRFISERIFPQGENEGRLIILGYPDSGKSEVVQLFGKIQQSEVKSIQSVDYTRLRLGEGFLLNVFAISIDSYFQPVMKKLSQNMLACFFLIDYRQDENVEYTKYLIQQIFAKYRVPLVFGISNIRGDIPKAIAGMRKLYEVPSSFEVIPVNPNDFHQIKQMFYHLKDNVPGEYV